MNWADGFEGHWASWRRRKALERSNPQFGFGFTNFVACPPPLPTMITNPPPPGFYYWDKRTNTLTPKPSVGGCYETSYLRDVQIGGCGNVLTKHPTDVWWAGRLISWRDFVEVQRKQKEKQMTDATKYQLTYTYSPSLNRVEYQLNGAALGVGKIEPPMSASFLRSLIASRLRAMGLTHNETTFGLVGAIYSAARAWTPADFRKKEPEIKTGHLTEESAGELAESLAEYLCFNTDMRGLIKKHIQNSKLVLKLNAGV